MRIFLFNIILVFISAENLFSATDTLWISKDSSVVLPDVYINKIVIAGNDITEDEIILREISTKENSKLDYKILNEDVQNIYKLGLFNKIDLIPLQSDSVNKINMMFLVEERFYILPVPQGGFRNGNLSNLWGGLNLIWKNFRGRNETLGLSFGIGYEPFVNLNYSVPWIGKNTHFYSSGSVSYSRNYNKSLHALNDTTSSAIPSPIANFTNHNFSASYGLGKFFSRNFSVFASLKYNLIKLSYYEPGRTLSKDGTDNFLTFSLGGKIDTRNSIEYTLTGAMYSAEYIKFGFGNEFNFSKINIDLRKFIPVVFGNDYSISLSTKFNSTFSFGGEIPAYLNEFYGYDKIIRGYKNIVLEGENQLGLFSEIRIPVINPFFLKGESMPVAKSVSMLKKLNYKFGLFATLFFDVGGVWDKTDNPLNTRYYNGFGAGLNYILPFGLVGRTDFAFRKVNKRFIPQVIFDMSASF